MTDEAKAQRSPALVTAIAVSCVALGCSTAAFADPAPAGTAEISGRSAIISGQGYMRTCQDSGVFLVPATGSPAEAQALNTARHADCDSEGRFRFSDVANGKY